MNKGGFLRTTFHLPCSLPDSLASLIWLDQQLGRLRSNFGVPEHVMHEISDRSSSESQYAKTSKVHLYCYDDNDLLCLG